MNISGPSSVDEGDATSNYTVSLSPSGVTPTADLTVSYATSNGTAIAGSDYTAASGTLTFTSAAAGSQTFTVQTTEDFLDESGETFTVTLSSLTGGGGPAPTLGTSSVTTTITDDDSAELPPSRPPSSPPIVPPPSTPTGIDLSVSPSKLAEDDGPTPVTVTVTLEGGSGHTQDIVVVLKLAGPADESDYTATTLASLTIPVGQSSKSGLLTITPVDDGISEGPESISITGKAPVLPEATASIVLTDATDDNGEVVNAYLSITPPSVETTEGSDAEFTVTLSHSVDADITVAWSAPLGTDAAQGADLGTTSGTVTFAANSAAGATQTITVTAVDDKLSEGAESFTVTLGTITSTLSSQVSIKNGASSATATIAESDPITINLSGPSSVDEGNTATYTVSLSPSGVTPTEDLTVSYATSDGTATAGSDYTAKSGALTFTQAASGAQTFTVRTTEDSLDEGSGETFTTTISSPGGGGGPAPTLGTSSVTTTINDDDDNNDVLTGIRLTASPSSLGEDDGATSVTVTATLQGGRVRPSATVVTIGTLSGAAIKDTDYTATSLATITIPANSRSGSGTITITPTDDTVVEGDETIVIPGTTTRQVGLTVTSATVTLTDDDKSTTDPIRITLSVSPSDLREGSDPVDVTVTATLDGYTTLGTSRDVAVSLADGTATSADYASATTIVTIPAGRPYGRGTLTVQTVDDTIVEASETISVVGTVEGFYVKPADLTILDNDGYSHSITLTVDPSEVRENAGATTFTVTAALDDGVALATDTVITIDELAGTATEDSDYSVTGSLASITISANSTSGSGTLSIDPTADAIIEGNETILVSGSTIVGLAVRPAKITLSDSSRAYQSDFVKLAISGPTSPVLEGSVANFTVTLSSAVFREIVVSWSAVLPGDSATAADLETTSGSVTFEAGSAAGATRTIALTVTDDALSEASETFTVSLEPINSDIYSHVELDPSASSASAVIAESDPITVHLSGPSSVEEGDTTSSYTVSLLPSGVIPTADLTVEYATADGTAKADSDFTPISGTLTFTQSDPGTKSLIVQTTEDTLDEGSGETFSLGISNPAGGGGPAPLLASTVTTTITDDDQDERHTPSGPTTEPLTSSSIPTPTPEPLAFAPTPAPTPAPLTPTPGPPEKSPESGSTLMDPPMQPGPPLSWLEPLPWWLMLLIAVLIMAIIMRIRKRLQQRNAEMA